MRKKHLFYGLAVAFYSLGLLVSVPALAATDELAQCKQTATSDYNAELKNIAIDQKTALAEAKTNYNNAKKSYSTSLKTEYANYKQGLKDCKSNTSVSACNTAERAAYLQDIKNAKSQLNADYKAYLVAIKQAPIDYKNAKKDALDNFNQAKQDCVDQQALIDQVDTTLPIDNTVPTDTSSPIDTTVPSQQPILPPVTATPQPVSSALPEVGWNPVNVNSCAQVGNDILISNAVNNGTPYTLTTACRNGGDGGYKFYTMQCLSRTQYRVDWRSCTASELAAVTTTAPTAQTCSETDNGIDYNVFGKTTGNDENTGVYGTYPDSCGAYVGDSGKTTGAYIAEKHCSSGNDKVYVHTQWYNCENGCSAGACLAQKPVVVVPVATCSETDNGIDYNVFGKTTGNDEVTGVYGTYPDSCGAYVGDSGKSTGAYIAEKHCSSGNGKIYVHTQWYNCENGCSAGACLAQKPVATTNCNGSPLAVALYNSPAAKNVSPGQSNVELTRVRITNTNCSDVKVGDIFTAFSSQNLNPNLLISNLKLSDVSSAYSTTQLSNTLTNPTLNDDVKISLVIPANTSKDISLSSDISSSATAGWFQTAVNALSWTNLNTGDVSSTRTYTYGNQMTIVTR